MSAQAWRGLPIDELPVERLDAADDDGPRRSARPRARARGGASTPASARSRREARHVVAQLVGRRREQPGHAVLDDVAACRRCPWRRSARRAPRPRAARGSATRARATGTPAATRGPATPVRPRPVEPAEEPHVPARGAGPPLRARARCGPSPTTTSGHARRRALDRRQQELARPCSARACRRRRRTGPSTRRRPPPAPRARMPATSTGFGMISMPRRAEQRRTAARRSRAMAELTAIDGVAPPRGARCLRARLRPHVRDERQRERPGRAGARPDAPRHHARPSTPGTACGAPGRGSGPTSSRPASSRAPCRRPGTPVARAGGDRRRRRQHVLRVDDVDRVSPAMARSAGASARARAARS